MTYEQMVDLCKRERIRKNISVNEIAEKTGVERGNLYRFEKHPEVKMYSCLLAYFNGLSELHIPGIRLRFLEVPYRRVLPWRSFVKHRSEEEARRVHRMSGEELRQAFLSGAPVKAGEITYDHIDSIVYWKDGNTIRVSAVLVDKNKNSTTRVLSDSVFEA